MSNIRGNQMHQKFMSGKRKYNISNYCESSSSAYENLETSYDQLLRHVPSTRWSSKEIYNPDMEVDESQLPNSGFNSYMGQKLQIHDKHNVSVSQIESDELFAHQLQKQYCDEVVERTTTEEIDASLAWLLQEELQEEDPQLAASAARSDQLNNGEESMAHLYAYYTQLHHRNSLARPSNESNHARASNARRNFYSPELDREMRILADVRNFRGMDPGLRHNFLEVLEAAFDNSNDALHDVNGDDYDMLFTRDNDTYKHMGASEDQISSLPRSIIQSDNVDKTCAICLKKPSVGENIRHMPCLHKFHTECIDRWLSRKACCPVCKSEIS